MQILLINFYSGTEAMFSVPFPVITLVALLILIVTALFSEKKTPRRHSAFPFRLYSAYLFQHAALAIRISHAQEYSISAGNTAASSGMALFHLNDGNE
ncbi:MULTISPECIES: hypothetical protein [Pantoea]|uniref:Uncharacterized protein n=1 Tax=Pantoea brenneri TaxID=472694 RepID=A0ABU9MNW2_9GAMM|nr:MULTISPECIES: hypothetical protein [unclassified Pantoea]